MTAREQGIVEAARHVFGRHVELAVVLDADGTELWRGRGGRTSVTIPPDLPLGHIVVHTHPDERVPEEDIPLSYQDVAGLLNWGAGEVVAVHRNWTHRMRLAAPRPLSRFSLAARGALSTWRRQELEGIGPATVGQLEAVALLLGAEYTRLPTRAWLAGTGWVAPAVGPAIYLKPRRAP